MFTPTCRKWLDINIFAALLVAWVERTNIEDEFPSKGFSLWHLQGVGGFRLEATRHPKICAIYSVVSCLIKNQKELLKFWWEETLCPVGNIFRSEEEKQEWKEASSEQPSSANFLCKRFNTSWRGKEIPWHPAQWGHSVSDLWPWRTSQKRASVTLQHPSIQGVTPCVCLFLSVGGTIRTSSHQTTQWRPRRRRWVWVRRSHCWSGKARDTWDWSRPPAARCRAPLTPPTTTTHLQTQRSLTHRHWNVHSCKEFNVITSPNSVSPGSLMMDVPGLLVHTFTELLICCY